MTVNTFGLFCLTVLLLVVLLVGLALCIVIVIDDADAEPVEWDEPTDEY